MILLPFNLCVPLDRQSEHKLLQVLLPILCSCGKNFTDTEMKARIQGISGQMATFKFLFGLFLSEIILQHTDKLSQTLQNPQMSSVEAREIAMLTVKTLQSLRIDTNFNLFWEKVEKSSCFEHRRTSTTKKAQVT